ncbi:hypothetical protein [Taibaiella koreensis]|uniref:hypothetical protein n=1 Tax=Taibaiella koreensis TaxID=1268548 RepID=UPI000E59C527|nr:hypothetical protein [Taibaiella koreensis]
MALYIFGIGGTGARVIKAFTFLMASGVKLAHTHTVVPILIDPDNENGDLNRTLKLLRGYRSLREHTERDTNQFFYHDIRSLMNVEDSPTASEFHFSLNRTESHSFGDLLDMGNMSDATKAMTRLLFSEQNLKEDMHIGFKGNPNIGSVALNQFKDSPVFKAFANAFNTDDRIMVIGSIFGGTGAAGLPLLIKNLRDADTDIPKHMLLRNAPIAAISVLPYFDVQGETSIDSDTFVSKTKAALSYYAANLCRNRSVNALYYLGDAVSNTHKGADGGVQQENGAHFVELAAAMAIVDFMELDNNALQVEGGKAVSPMYFEYGLKEETNEIRLQHLGRRSFDTAGKRLAAYFLFQKFLRDSYATTTAGTAWMSNGSHKLGPDDLDKRMMDDLDRFNYAFNQWLEEMERSITAFKPFQRDAGEKDILNAVSGFSEQTSFMGPKGLDRFSKTLSEKEAKLPPLGNSERKLFALFSVATQELITQRIKL